MNKLKTFTNKKDNQTTDKHNLNKLCLGRASLNNWEILMIREGMIDKISNTIDDRDVSDELLNSKEIKVWDKRFLLFSMVLFDKIDSSRLSKYDLSKLIDLGVIEEHAMIAEDRLAYRNDPFDSLTEDTYSDDSQMRYLNEISKEIMLANKNQVIAEIGKKIRIDGMSYYQPTLLEEKYDEWIVDCELWSSKKWERMPNKEELGIFKEGVMSGLYQSMVRGSVYYDGVISSRNLNLNFDRFDLNKLQENITQIISLDLSPELYSLPIPSNINEVIQLRKRPEIVSFRKIFFEWCNFLKNGDVEMASKVKQDIKKAQTELEKYYKWENSKVKTFSCLFDAFIGQIPYISNIVSAVSPFSLRKMFKQRVNNSWVLLLR